MPRSSIELLSVLVLTCFLILLAVIAVDGIIKEQDRKSSEKMVKHQEWLFNQLYSIAPGKVLLPEEDEEDSEMIASKVYEPYKDPLKQFEGHNDDWHG